VSNLFTFLCARNPYSPPCKKHKGLDVTANGYLNVPLGLTTGKNCAILSTNGGDGSLVVTSTNGIQLAAIPLIPGGEAGT